MARHIRLPFQLDKPVFVRIPFSARGKDWAVGTHFKWNEFGLDAKRVMTLYTQGYLYHDDELEEILSDKIVGDGLEQLSIEALNEIVDEINAKVKEKAKPIDYQRVSCKKSRVKDRQIALIRTWRRNYGTRYE